MIVRATLRAYEELLNKLTKQEKRKLNKNKRYYGRWVFTKIILLKWENTRDEIVGLRRIFVAAIVTCHSIVRFHEKKKKKKE